MFTNIMQINIKLYNEFNILIFILQKSTLSFCYLYYITHLTFVNLNNSTTVFKENDVRLWLMMTGSQFVIVYF